MKAIAVGLAVFITAALILGLFLTTPQREAVTTATTTKQITITSVSTVVRFTTVDKPGYSLPQPLMEKVAEIVPDYEKIQGYHILLPSEPGTYSYSFAVFWPYGENHTHLIFFHCEQTRRFVLTPSSFVQVRFVAARNIPNIQASVFPRGEIVETVVTDGGETSSKRWDIVPTIPGYPSTPQVERGGNMVWIVSYRPVEKGEYGESLVARYYFLEVTVSR
ncbi:MAG: hypothetical protein QXF45_07285 [Candidatus Caldarchaeum sp.]